MLKPSILTLWSVYALLSALGGCKAQGFYNEILRGAQEMQSSYEKSGAVQAEETFQTGALHQVLQSEKKKTADCEELVNKMLKKAESQKTEKALSQQDCYQIVEGKLKEIEDEDQRNKARPELEKMCANLASSTALEAEQKEREKLKQIEKCQDLLGSAIASVDEASERTANLPSPEQESCTHDYTFLCPEGWYETGDGSTCEAPASYAGPCSTLGTFAKTTEEKKEIERNCRVNYPCLKECERDYSTLCPEMWTDVGGGKCSAPFSYSGRCERTFQFSQLSDKEKDKWGTACGARWRCKPPCERDYNVSCPKGWKSADNGVCEAPVGYVGPCGPRLLIGHFSSKMKSVFEHKCGALFPCKEICDQDFSVACPKGWLLISTHICSPPDTYAGHCNKDQDFEGKTEEEKRLFSTDCGAPWPCLQECRRDYSEPCPLEWKQQGDYCFAPNTYHGPCATRRSFVGYSEDMKAAESLECKLYWPCLHEAIVRPMVEGTPQKGRTVGVMMPGRKRRWNPGVSGPIEPGTGLIMAVPA